MILRLSSFFFTEIAEFGGLWLKVLQFTKLRCLQDLFDDSEPLDTTNVQNDEKPNNLLDEEFAPSLQAMNLKFDSVPMDDRLVEFEALFCLLGYFWL